MEQRSASDVKKQLQPLLREFEGDDGIVIEEITDEAGSAIGDNYTSIMIRTKIVGRYGDGSPYKRNLMTKIYPRDRAVSEFMKTKKLFVTEGHVYKNILPLLGNFGPRCIHVGPEEIIMEDLRDQGYKTCERKLYLDLNHCLAAIKGLAVFHAKSFSIKTKDPSTFEKLVEPLKEAIFYEPTDGTSFPLGKTLNNSVKHAIEHLESIEPRTAEVQKSIDYLHTYDDNSFETLLNLMNVPKEKSFVILHGDTWENNILFKHDDQGNVEDAKFVDYQISRYLSVALDLHYFIYSSARACVIENDYEKLIEEYHRTFTETLKECDVPEEDRKLFDMSWLKSELKRFALYGLFTGLWLVHAVLADGEQLLDMDKITVEELQAPQVWLQRVIPEKARRIQLVVSHYIRTYGG